MKTHEIVEMTNLFMRMLNDIFAEPVVEAMLLANAMDWADTQGLKFVWFMEDAYGRTHNGLCLVDKRGQVVYDEIMGFEDEEDKLLMQAFAAQTAMHLDEEEED